MTSIGDKDIEADVNQVTNPRRHSQSSGHSTVFDVEKNNIVNKESNTVALGTQDGDLKISADADQEKAVVAEPPKPQPSPISPPPNGGLVAWTQVLGSYFLFFNTWGLINAYGAFQTYYMQDLLKTESPSNVSWVGSVQSFIILFVGTIVGPVYDAGHMKLLIRIGTVCLVLGLMMTSLCKELWQLVLAQGILTGIGGGCLFLPSIAIIPQYFTTRKSLAIGFASAGSSTGGIIYPIVFHKLQPQIGFPWATRVIGFIALATLLVPCFVMRVRVYPQGRRKLIQLSAYKEPAFSLNQLAGFILWMGFFAPFFYIESYSLAQPGDDKSVAFYLLSMILAGSFFGRILPNFFADRTGPFAVLVPASLISALLELCWIGIKSTSGLIAFAVLFGFFTGGLVSIVPLTVVIITRDLRDLGTRLGMFMAVSSIAVLIGGPIFGAILNGTGSYLGIQLFSGLCLAVGATLLIPTWILAKRARARWAAEDAAAAN